MFQRSIKFVFKLDLRNVSVKSANHGKEKSALISQNRRKNNEKSDLDFEG